MIDLKGVLAKYPDCLDTRTRLAGLLRDLYPDEKRMVNVILAVYQSGIAARIAGVAEIDAAQLHSFAQLLDDEHGLQKQYAVQGIELWAKAYGIKVVQPLTTQSVSAVPDNQAEVQPQKVATPQAIVHAANAYSSPGIVPGEASAYELRAIDNDSVEIVKFRGFEQAEIVVPNVIDGKKVIGIGEEAYRDCNGMTKLTISESIEYIGGRAFSNCGQLESVRLPNSLKSLGSGAFSGCISLTTVDLPNGITKIPHNAFLNCQSLVSVNLPDQLKEIDAVAFYDCRKLCRIVCPNTLKKIGDSAFYYCKALQEIILNEGLQIIGREAFSRCEIRGVVIPSTVKSIGIVAFPQSTILYCYRDSYGLQWARQYRHRFKNAAKASAYLLDPSVPRP